MMPAPDQQAQAPTISMVDLQNLLMVIDLATQRGAFRGPELSQIGQLFDRVNTFVQHAMPPPTDGNDNQPAQQIPPTPAPVMPMTPPFAPKAGA
jgi:hypothetical protein